MIYVIKSQWHALWFNVFHLAQGGPPLSVHKKVRRARDETCWDSYQLPSALAMKPCQPCHCVRGNSRHLDSESSEQVDTNSPVIRDIHLKSRVSKFGPMAIFWVALHRVCSAKEPTEQQLEPWAHLNPGSHTIRLLFSCFPSSPPNL